jgi:hypothetical protein
MCGRLCCRGQYSSLVFIPKPLIFWWKIFRDVFPRTWLESLIIPSFSVLPAYCWWLSTKIVSSCYRYLSISSGSCPHCLRFLLSIVTRFCWNPIFLIFRGISFFSNSSCNFPWVLLVFVCIFLSYFKIFVILNNLVIVVHTCVDVTP